MMSVIEPRRLIGQQLTTRATGSADYAVLVDGMRAGRIMKQTRAFGVEVWFWTVTGPALAQSGLASSGEAETLEGARQAFRAAFDQWLSWALEASGAVYWME